MRLATIRTADGPRLHVRGTGGHVDVAAATGDERLATLTGLLAGGPEAMEKARRLTTREGVAYEPSAFGPAVPSPPRVLCLGRNYHEHAREVGDAVTPWPETFVRGADSVAAPYADLPVPALTGGYDYEGELGVVIGTGGRYIPAAKAAAAIAGYVVVNDLTARDWQRAGMQWTPGKNFDASLPIGPELVTPDEGDVSDAELTTRLNGTVMQAARTSQMVVGVAESIEFFSSFTTLRPGDVIATGTPGGVGFVRKPPVWLRPGDVIEVTIENIGTIRNRLVAEDSAPADWAWRVEATGRAS